MTCLFKFWRKKSHALTNSLTTTTKAIGKILLFSSCATATREGSLIFTIQPCSIDLNHGLAILKSIGTRSETPKKTMEYHEALYYLTSLWWHWQCFFLHDHTWKKLMHNLQQSRQIVVRSFLVVVDVFNGLLLCQLCFVVRGGVSFSAFDVCYQGWHWSWWIIFNQVMDTFTDDQI